MKRTIKLTERDLIKIIKRVINEQTPIGFNLAKTSPNLTRGIGRLGRAEDGVDVGIESDIKFCEIEKPIDKIVKEIFTSLEKSSQIPPTEKVKNYIFRLEKSMEGLGATDDVYTVFKEVKDRDVMSSIIRNWKSITKSKDGLYDWIADEMTIRWVVLYSILQSNNFYGVKFNPCLKNKTYSI